MTVRYLLIVAGGVAAVALGALFVAGVVGADWLAGGVVGAGVGVLAGHVDAHVTARR